MWILGEAVRTQVNRPLLARADIQVVAVKKQKLKAIRDDVGFERHANILGWPQIQDEAARKRAWKGIAAALADSAELRLPA